MKMACSITPVEAVVDYIDINGYDLGEAVDRIDFDAFEDILLN